MREVDNIVEHNHKLVFTTAKRYAKAVPHKRDDIISAGNMGLLNGAIAIVDGKCKHEDKVPFLVSRIKYAILEYLNSDHLIRIPASSARLEHVHPAGIRQYHDNIEYANHVPMYRLLNDLPVSDEQRNIIRQKVCNFTQKEIAQMNGRSIGYVNKQLKIIKEIVHEYLY